ncbi:carbohydrate kinase family protein [Flavobacteriaceae bacterium TP-CH-4]|uniref:Carbohydrate kinase family protein n=1 Tax=Pelagihabitans pacificus TaxID=2696054 RepID=A0A967EEM7_9FLAO|nr:PfkB family carbohydrate kinase [Pelagihabitans pacificus]NHF60528.1 carbohydrate kinase family protein [Pelagihabitans pacificus]
MANHKVGVLGPIPRDHITTHRGEVIEKYGCATHTAIGLSKLLNDDGTVYLVSHLRQKDEQAVKEILGVYPNINLDHITSDADQGDVISLRFVDQNNRLEKQTGFMNPILPEDIEGLLDCEVFICVPITDFEIPLETLKYIRENSEAIIIFDAHGPTNTCTTSGDRLTRFWIDRDQWLPYIDVLKMNLEESKCCWFEKEYETENLGRFDEEDTSHLPALAAHVLDRGVKSLIVTLDAGGGVVFYKKEGRIQEEIVPSVKVDHVVDTTGCGDSFAGGLGYGLLEDPTDYIKATKYANALGALRTQGRTFEVFKSKQETDRIITETYGSL